MTPADFVFTGGTIFSADASHPRTSGLAVAEGLVVAVGSEALDTVGAETEVVDLTGRTLVPGFRDGHIHPLWGGTELGDCDVVDAASVDDVIERVRQFVATHPGDGWVVGAGYPPEILPDGIGEAAWLDSAEPQRPVALWASDHHTMWVNSAALAVAGIDAATPDPDRGSVARRGDGSPVGTLLESATELMEGHLPTKSVDDKAQGLRLAMAAMAEAGLVWAQEAALAPQDVDVYLGLAEAGKLTADFNIALRVDPARWRRQGGDFLAARHRSFDTPGRDRRDGAGRVTVGTVKFFADGVIETGTGALLEPYTDDPCSCGIPNWSPPELAEAAAFFDGLGFQLHIHAIGDAGVRMALDAVEHTMAENGRRDRRPVIAHTHLVHPDDVPRFAALGVIANFEPLWAQQNAIMTDLTEPRLGPERSQWQYPIGSIWRGGATVSFGSDWPVSSLVPMEGLAVAVHRQTPEGHPGGGWLPDEKIHLDQAISAYTAGTAYQAGAGPGAGMLTVGSRADLCLLGAELLTLPVADLAAVPVDGTWLAGKPVYRR